MIVEQSFVLPAHDFVGEVGPNVADDHTFFFNVTDGHLNVGLIRRQGFNQPLLNAIRVTQRPDM